MVCLFRKSKVGEGKRPKGRFLLIRKYFCVVYDYAGKADLSIGY